MSYSNEEREKLLEILKRNMGYAEATAKIGQDLADEVLDHHVFVDEHLKGKLKVMFERSVEMIDQLPDEVDTQDLINVVLQICSGAFVYGGLAYKIWLTQHGVDVLGMEKKAKEYKGV